MNDKPQQTKRKTLGLWRAVLFLLLLLLLYCVLSLQRQQQLLDQRPEKVQPLSPVVSESLNKTMTNTDSASHEGKTNTGQLSSAASDKGEKIALDLSLPRSNYREMSQLDWQLQPLYLIDWQYKTDKSELEISPSIEFYPLEDSGQLHKPWQQIKGWGLEFEYPLEVR